MSKLIIIKLPGEGTDGSSGCLVAILGLFFLSWLSFDLFRSHRADIQDQLPMKIGTHPESDYKFSKPLFGLTLGMSVEDLKTMQKKRRSSAIKKIDPDTLLEDISYHATLDRYRNTNDEETKTKLISDKSITKYACEIASTSELTSKDMELLFLGGRLCVIRISMERDDSADKAFKKFVTTYRVKRTSVKTDERDIYAALLDVDGMECIIYNDCDRISLTNFNLFNAIVEFRRATVKSQQESNARKLENDLREISQ